MGGFLGQVIVFLVALAAGYFLPKVAEGIHGTVGSYIAARSTTQQHVAHGVLGALAGIVLVLLAKAVGGPASGIDIIAVVGGAIAHLVLAVKGSQAI